jgi:hypothetical protein
VHGLGPGAGERTDQPAAIQQVLLAALDQVPLAAMEMRGIRGEPPTPSSPSTMWLPR